MDIFKWEGGRDIYLAGVVFHQQAMIVRVLMASTDSEISKSNDTRKRFTQKSSKLFLICIPRNRRNWPNLPPSYIIEGKAIPCVKCYATFSPEPDWLPPPKLAHSPPLIIICALRNFLKSGRVRDQNGWTGVHQKWAVHLIIFNELMNNNYY